MKVLADICGIFILGFLPGLLGVAFAAALITTRRTRRPGLRHRAPDYSRIASMERDIWGEKFEHAELRRHCLA